MFSRKERDFLALLVRADAESGSDRAELFAAFPNPSYRRKLMWGIRRKATEAAADLALYADAARVESKVLPVSTAPVYAVDPLVTVIRTVQALLRTNRSRPVAVAEDARTVLGSKERP